MKKIILIVILTITVIVAGVILINNFLLNNNEKEILEVLKDLDNSLQNPKEKEEGTFNFMPSEPMTLKKYIDTIYEVRKINTESGNITFLFKVKLLKENGDNYEGILAVVDGEIKGMTIDDKTIENINDDVEENNFTNSLQKAFIKGINKIITEKWDEASKINNVNFIKILNRI